MTFRRLCAAVFALLGCAAPKGGRLVEIEDSHFRPGQVWAYDTRPGEDSSTLTILRVEQSDRFGRIVHVAVDGLTIRDPRARGGVIRRIEHLPFGIEAIGESVVRQIRDSGSVPRYDAGYAAWRRAFVSGRSGIFTRSVRETLDRFEPQSGK